MFSLDWNVIVSGYGKPSPFETIKSFEELTVNKLFIFRAKQDGLYWNPRDSTPKAFSPVSTFPLGLDKKWILKSLSFFLIRSLIKNLGLKFPPLLVSSPTTSNGAWFYLPEVTFNCSTQAHSLRRGCWRGRQHRQQVFLSQPLTPQWMLARTPTSAESSRSVRLFWSVGYSFVVPYIMWQMRRQLF